MGRKDSPIRRHHPFQSTRCSLTKQLRAGALLALLSTTSLVCAQPELFAGALTATQATEAAAWSQSYAHLLATNEIPLEADDFAFTTAAMNGPLFSLRHSAARTTAAATGLAVDPCLIVLGNVVSYENQSTLDVIAYLASTQVLTDMLADPAATIAHIDAIASSTVPVEIEINGSLLVSNGLSAVAVSGEPVIAWTVLVSARTAGDIAALSVLAPQIIGNLNAAGHDGSNQAWAELNAVPLAADLLRAELEEQLPGVLDPASEARVGRADAVFGVYGRLALIVVEFDDGVVLVDSITGNIAGPFDPAGPWSASNLLEDHPQAYTMGQAYEIIDAEACVLGKWRRAPADDSTDYEYLPRRTPRPDNTPHPLDPYTDPQPLKAPWPIVPQPVQLDPNKDGNISKWFCNGGTGGQPCRCVSYGIELDYSPNAVPRPTSRYARRQCVNNQSNCNPNQTGDPEVGPGSPRPTPASQSADWTCETWWWHN
jgi:hypothetical protein